MAVMVSWYRSMAKILITIQDNLCCLIPASLQESAQNSLEIPHWHDITGVQLNAMQGFPTELCCNTISYSSQKLVSQFLDLYFLLQLIIFNILVRILAFSWLDIASSLSLILKVSTGNLVFSLELAYFQNALGLSFNQTGLLRNYILTFKPYSVVHYNLQQIYYNLVNNVQHSIFSIVLPFS